MVGGFISSLAVPWLIGGDFNVDPGILISSGALHRWRGHVVSPNVSTYNSGKVSTTIDYFIVSNMIRTLHSTSVVNHEAGTAPHCPLEIDLYTGYRRQTVRTPKKPKKLHFSRPATVPREHPDYTSFTDNCDNAGSQNDLDALLFTMGDRFTTELLSVHDITEDHQPYRGRFAELQMITIPKIPSFTNTIHKASIQTHALKVLSCVVNNCLATLNSLWLLRHLFDLDSGNLCEGFF